MEMNKVCEKIKLNEKIIEPTEKLWYNSFNLSSKYFELKQQCKVE